ncbi:MAG: hypothetical protein ACJZ63_03985 [Candidatus Poseidoniaceae archaeon]|tara:strand:+ start:3495 stop:4958 length:1464 start_codon:yes stop_codon:yes gene_type:complete
MSKPRNRLSEAAYDAVEQGLIAALERGTQSWPLPSPPISDPDFPALPPKSPQTIIDQGVGLLQVDRGMFERNLNTVVDLIVPHRMNLSDDPYEVHERWLKKRVPQVAERLLFAIATDWLSQAFDQQAPNVDRWWLAVALVDGLAVEARGQSVHQGYHLVESIALAERPGTWHTQPDAGPHQMEWNPHAVLPRQGGVVAHDAGVEAAVWLLTRLENGPLERRLLLMEWSRLLLQRPNLVGPLHIDQILMRRALDPEEEVASRVCLCLAKAIEYDRDGGLALAQRLHTRTEVLIRRGMADVLTRLFRRLTWDAVPFLEAMLADEDEGVLAAASATVGDLRFLDVEKWADTMAELSNHPLPVVRRNLVPFLRDYLEQYPDDQRRLLPMLWVDGDEVVRTRMRELLMRMEEVAPDHFAARLKDFMAQGCDLEPLWTPLTLRRPERSEAWQAFLRGEGEQPTLPERPPVSDNILDGDIDEDNEIDQELGFLD